jgi:hypothetical protein
MHAIAAVSAAGRSRFGRACAWLESRAGAEEVLIVAASLDAANELARRLARQKGAAFGCHRLTLAQLAKVMGKAELTYRGLASITPLGTMAVVTRLVHRLKTAAALGRFEPIAATPGFPRAVASAITELRLAEVSRERLAEVAPDLGRLLVTYDTELACMNLTDWTGILALAAEGAATHRLSGLPLLMLDVPMVSDAEFRFVRALAANAPEILATVPAADEATIDRFRDDLGWSIEDLDVGPLPGPGAPLARLQRNLFRDDTPPAPSTPSPTLEIFSAPGEGRECVEIARRVLARAREGVSFDRIVVLLRAPEEYRAHLEEAFGRAGIPALPCARGTPSRSGRPRLFCLAALCA